MGLNTRVCKPIKDRNTALYLFRLGNKWREYHYLMLNDYPELSFFKKFIHKKKFEYYNVEKWINDNIKENNKDWKECGWRSESEEDDDINICIRNDKTEEEKYVNINEFETYIKWENVIYYRVISDLRRGENERFHKDNMWDSPCVLDINKLKEIGNKYFLKKTKYRGYNFDRVILKRFKPRKTFVCFC